MNKEFLKGLTQAHSWLGLIISAILFVVFFAGSIALFRTEITQWSMQPHFKLSQGEALTVSEILAKIIEDEAFDAKEHLTIVMPEEHMPYYRAYVDIVHQVGEQDHAAFYVDPITGEKLTKIDVFFLSDFIYELHTDLNISAGRYIVGFVTLFFFFALISGIFIHAKKLIGNFFKYRSKNTSRSQLLDMHTVVGVISLPYTVMYAISGLIFNLVLIYQIAFAVVLYKGDQQALLDDAGFKAITPQWQEVAWQQPDIDGVIARAELKYGFPPNILRVYNYGDESAVLRLIGKEHNSLANEYEVAYELSDNNLLYANDFENPNTLVEGLSVLSQLHFGNYAGFDLRILYFLLGLGVCSLIVTGNLLWIEKRSRQRNQSPKTLKFVTNFTLWGSGGFIIATAVAFVVERLLPVTYDNRADLMVYSFIATLLVTAILLVFNQNKKYFLGGLLSVSSALLLLVITLDWFFFMDEILLLWEQGVKTVIGVEVGLATVAILLGYIGSKLLNIKSKLINEGDAVMSEPAISV